HLVEIRGVTVEMYGHTADRAGAHFRRRVLQVDCVAVIDVDENGLGAREADRLDGRECRVRWHQHLVARLDAEGLQRHPERGRGAAGEDGVFAAEIAGEFPLEASALGTENVLTRVDGCEHRSFDFVIDGWARQRYRHQRVSPGGWRRPNRPR